MKKQSERKITRGKGSGREAAWGEVGGKREMVGKVKRNEEK